MALQFRIIPVTQFEQNCSILWCDQTGIGAVVDPGGNFDRIDSEVKNLGINIKKILITHAHADHASLAKHCSKSYAAEIEGPHKKDLFWIRTLAIQGKLLGIRKAAGFKPNRWLNGGEQIKVGNEKLEVLYCPGHTAGHVVFVSHSAKLIAVGDVLFKGSIGRSDLPGGDHQTLVKSIKENLWPLGEDYRFIPGHGPMSTIGHERKTNPFVADPNYR
ncbi:MAG: MBL fold metallo-hydrolase [Pseudomonadales bacterium]|nr:MBL fold metallo-hydrolase [Pseudomonadales bacterium]